MQMARIAILIDESAARRRRHYGINVFASVYEDLLAHRGVPYRKIESASVLSHEDLDLVLVGMEGDDAGSDEALLSFARSGAVVVSCGGLDGLASRLGYTPGDEIGPGYASPGEEDDRLGFVVSPALRRETPRSRYLRARPWTPRDGEASERDRPSLADGAGSRMTGSVSSGHALLDEIRVGQGLVSRFAVDIADTVTALRQGPGPVLRDGAPAPDGTAGIDDGVLKADDQIALDWQSDRVLTPSGIPFFAYPYADWWRELLVGYLVRLMRERGRSLPFTSYWPGGASAVAMISHDSDGNEDAHADTTLELLREQDIRSTWCLLAPGYSEATHGSIADRGHELALHFNAVPEDGGNWAQSEFNGQLARLRERVEKARVSSNKNHLTRLEGWAELFRWCESAGITADQTRGPSKRGNLGFIFGTAHPYRPAAWFDEDNRLYDVTEMGFLTPDMNTGTWADDSLIDPLLDRVIVAEGLAHILFHPVHLHERKAVRDAFRLTIAALRSRGLSFHTGAELDAWERMRRSVTVTGLGRGGEPVLCRADRREEGSSSAGSSAFARGRGLTVLVPLSPREAERVEATEQCYGVACRVWTV